jgi:hypothetical protein
VCVENVLSSDRSGSVYKERLKLGQADF